MMHHTYILRVGIIGLGRAAVSMLPSFVNYPFVKIVAACDIRSEARERFAIDFGVPVYASAEDLLKDPNIDAVYIATPHEFHAYQTILAAEHGKHVLVEKPMALSIEDCDAMIAAAKRNGVQIVVGHTHSFDRPILKIREIVRSGKLGRVVMIHNWCFSNFLYRPRRPEELDTARGGGIIFNQVPHQVDIIRLIGGGLVQSVRSKAWILDQTRPTEGSHVTYLEFTDGIVATLVYSGYDYFDTDEFHFWIGEEGEPKYPYRHGAARRALRTLQNPEAELSMKARGGYIGHVHDDRSSKQQWYQPHFGITIASCEHGDMRPGPNCVLLYTEDGYQQVPIPRALAVPDKISVLEELYNAITKDRRAIHDGEWGRASLEVCLAILQSSQERREVVLTRQVPVND